MMRLTNRKLLSAAEALKWLREQKKPTKTSFKIARMLKMLEPSLEVIDDERNRIRREYTMTDDSGVPMLELVGGQHIPRLSDLFAVEDATKELLDQEVDVDVESMEYAQFEKTFKNCEPGHVFALVEIGFVVDPEAEVVDPEAADEDDTEDEDGEQDG